MLQLKQIRYIGYFLAAIFVLFACNKKTLEVPIEEGPKGITLNWNLSDNETKTEVETGLRWYLSMLGATLPKGCWEKGIVWKNSTQFFLDFTELGFNPEATKQLQKLASLYADTEEYTSAGGIDLGRFVANTLNNSDHYYKIVGLPEQYIDFLTSNQLANYEGFIHPSSVSFGYRKILFPALTNLQMTFISEEFTKDFTTGNEQPKEFKVIDVMSNGQLRFGVYENGTLLNGAKKIFSAGGKPSKCMWCHQSSFQPNFDNSESLKGYVSGKAFNDTISLHNKKLTDFRLSMESILDYSKEQEHTQMELLYIRFFEPSAQRLANEWGVSLKDIRKRLSGLKSHTYPEFPKLGDLYFRHEVEPLAPYKSMPSPLEMRETEELQPKVL
jgi:hypothetical protein